MNHIAALQAMSAYDKAQQELRDGFAKAALIGLIATSEFTASEDYLAKRAYQLADAMLRHRSKEPRCP